MQFQPHTCLFRCTLLPAPPAPALLAPRPAAVLALTSSSTCGPLRSLTWSTCFSGLPGEEISPRKARLSHCEKAAAAAAQALVRSRDKGVGWQHTVYIKQHLEQRLKP